MTRVDLARSGLADTQTAQYLATYIEGDRLVQRLEPAIRIERRATSTWTTRCEVKTVTT